MDLLKKEMERKKKAVEAAKKQQGGSRFLKASELRRLQEEKEEEEAARERKRKYNSIEKKTMSMEKEEEADSTTSDNKRSRSLKDKEASASKDEKAVSKKQTDRVDKERTSDEDTTTTVAVTDIESLSSEEVMQRLRALGLPIQMFGEQESHRQERLREAMENQKNVMAGLSEMEEFRLGSGHGIRNPFLERDKKGDARDEALQEPPVASKVKDDDAKKAAAKKDKDEQDDADEDDPHKRIYRFFKGLLRQWEDDLALRPEAVKRTAAGRNETKTLKQCKDYIRPLFKLCKTRRLEPSLMSHILKIVQYCEEGDFVKANDSYMDVAIGRAAWPIGVTMVGIHARSGRAKIESANVAHVMNSELQRKYLTSVKRLMSYYQNKRDDVAPSKKVLN